jgi:proteasome accessory factor C
MAVAEGHVPRLLQLVRILEKRGELSLTQLADELGAPAREVADDVRLLSTCGIPPYSPADLFEIELEGAQVRLGRRLLSLPRFQLSAEEVAGLRLAARLAQLEGWGESRALRRAVSKLEAVLLPEERERGRRLARRIGIPGASPVAARHLTSIERALRGHLEVEMTYYSESSERLSKRRVRPYHLVAAPEGRYLIGLDVGQRGIRTFRVDRIQRLKVTTKDFSPPEDFDAADEMPSAASQGERRLDVVLRFDPQVARSAKEQFRGAKEEKDGAVTVKLKVWPGPGFWRLVLSWAGNCEVLEPDSERRAVGDYAREIETAHY